MAERDIFNPNINNTMSVDDFNQIQASSISQAAYYLKETWVTRIKEIIKQNYQEAAEGQRSWFNLSETNREAYEIGKLKKFLVQQKYLMEDTILQMIKSSVKNYVDSVNWFLPISTVIHGTGKVKNQYYSDEEIKAIGAKKKKFPLFQIDLVLNDDNEVDVIYLDFAKAFDKVDHSVLLSKLERYGVKGKAYNWIKEFLCDRKQIVVVERCVPRNSAGPNTILFVLYINDLLSTINHCNGFSFADDTKLLGAIKGMASVNLLQEDLNTVIDWSKMNNMELHEQKFEVVSYSLNSSKSLRELPFFPENVEYRTPKGHRITPQDTVRDLGVHISGNRQWGPHIERTVQGARKMAAWTLSAFRDRTRTVMLTLYKSMVRSKLEYCCPV